MNYLQHIFSEIKQQKFVLVLILAMLLLAIVDQNLARDYFYFSRNDIATENQWWMLWTGNLSHATFSHWAMNIGAVLVLVYFFKSYVDSLHWLGVFVCMMPGVTIGLYLFNPEMQFYTGFSGVVQAWISCVLLRSFHETPKFNIVLLALQWGRIVYEQLPGYDVNYLQDWIGVAVAVDAHLYGALAGLLWGAICVLLKRRQSNSLSDN